MLSSEVKKEDINFRNQLLYLTESALRAYQRTGDQKEYEMAKYFGEMSKEMTKKIKNHDYTEDEKRRREIDKKLFGQLSTTEFDKTNT